MTRRLVAVAFLAAAFAGTAPAAQAGPGCQHPWVETWTGLYHPTTGERITYCSPTWPAP
jgi:hypothetical protein